MPAERNRPKRENFNLQTQHPFQLRLEDFEIAMQDVYDLFFDVNSGLLEKGLERLDDFNRDGRTVRCRDTFRRVISGTWVWSRAQRSCRQFLPEFLNTVLDLVQTGAVPTRERHNFLADVVFVSGNLAENVD